MPRHLPSDGVFIRLPWYIKIKMLCKVCEQDDFYFILQIFSKCKLTGFQKKLEIRVINIEIILPNNLSFRRFYIYVYIYISYKIHNSINHCNKYSKLSCWIFFLKKKSPYSNYIFKKWNNFVLLCKLGTKYKSWKKVKGKMGSVHFGA